ncbi:MAG: twin-arginine translocase TatA/TatE family subunit [Acidobacteriota bacterium]|nr:MAG: twin-arginine translocase TatA/TatE family subunit [Acidobacteriota bacterium]
MTTPLAFLSLPHGAELLILLLIIIIIFGARKLPEIGRGLGEGIKNFRGSMKEMSGDGAEGTDGDKKS